MHRLRDLDRRQALVALALVALVLVPFGVSVARAAHVHWLPSGDDALIGLRAHDVFTPERPLVGQPSTSHLYGPEAGTSHPGPIEFYWLAVPLRLLGPAAGMIVGIAVVNAASVLVAAWAVFRRAGPAAGAGAVAVLAAVLWSEGTAVLSDPISSNASTLPLFALAALAWAVLDGDLRLLPLATLVGSWVAQQHLAVVVPAITLVVLTVVGVGAVFVRRWRSTEDPDEFEPDPRRWPWLLGAVAVALVCWAPVLIEQATGDPGNLTAISEYAGTSDTPALGFRAGLRQAARAVGVPPLPLRTDVSGDDFFRGPVSPLEVVVAVATYLLLLGAAIWFRRRRRWLSLLAVTALVLAAGGVANGSSIPDSIEAFRVAFYRWAFVVAWLSWMVIGWVVALAVRWLLDRRDRDVPAWLSRVAPALAVVAVLIPAVAAVAVTPGWDDERRDQDGFPMMRTLSAAALDEATGADRVTLVLRGGAATLSTGPAITLQLEAAGHAVVLPGQEGRFYGEHRILEPGDDPGDVILLAVSGAGSLPDLPGRTLAHVELNKEQNALLERLTEQLLSADPVPSAAADELLARNYDPPGDAFVRDDILGDPALYAEKLLTEPRLLQMLIDGYYAEPDLDRADLVALQRVLPAENVNLDDQFELRVLTRAELAEVEPAWAD